MLADYAATGSEEAFRELVSHYVDLVYSTAVRLVDGDIHRAEDITQTVFADLSRVARTLPAGVMLGGWLHRRTWHAAATLMRGERRRRKREFEAMEINALQDRPEPAFEEIAPVLDDAINELSAADRTAIVLRFFERRDLRSIGATLQTNEDAAQKRVSRALEKLRLLLVRRGVRCSGVGLAAVLLSQAVTAAPAGLSASASAAALASAAAAGGGLSLGFLHLMTLAKFKIAVGTIVVAGLGTTLVLENRAQARAREENQALRQQIASLAQPAPGSSTPAAEAKPGSSLSEEQFRELLRLRGEVGVLRSQRSGWERLRAENRQLQSAKAGSGTGAATAEAKDYFPKGSLTFAGYADPDSAVQSLLWANTTLDGKTILAGFSPAQQEKWLKTHKTPEGVAAQIARCPVNANMTKVQGFRILDRQTTADDEVFYTVYVEGLDVKFKQKMKRIGGEWKFDGEFRAD